MDSATFFEACVRSPACGFQLAVKYSAIQNLILSQLKHEHICVARNNVTNSKKHYTRKVQNKLWALNQITFSNKFVTTKHSEPIGTSKLQNPKITCSCTVIVHKWAFTILLSFLTSENSKEEFTHFSLSNTSSLHFISFFQKLTKKILEYDIYILTYFKMQLTFESTIDCLDRTSTWIHQYYIFSLLNIWFIAVKKCIFYV